MAPRKVTIAELHRLHREAQPIVALSLYDAVTAGFADESGTHIILIGDSVGMTMLGYADTIGVTLEQSLHHTAAVARGTKYAMVVGDMPFLTYNVNVAEAMHNAGRFMQEAGA
ncbi:MAG: 3-methyl-2-oxobutanoate hydroxymethyltransferase, partial [Lentisphaeria bacterium]|nr:3-methyl-2-oxobutanoate hydroxymethyltransferase [Lentisphaeria bacterium]